MQLHVDVKVACVQELLGRLRMLNGMTTRFPGGWLSTTPRHHTTYFPKLRSSGPKMTKEKSSLCFRYENKYRRRQLLDNIAEHNHVNKPSAKPAGMLIS